MNNFFKQNEGLVIRNGFRCNMRWDDMPGDDFTRFCWKCKSNVHDLSELRDDEIITFIKLHGGMVCGKLQMTRDGKVINGKCEGEVYSTLGVLTLEQNEEKIIENSLFRSVKRTRQLRKLLEVIKEKGAPQGDAPENVAPGDV
ncbi:MAG: hypothetical protein ABJA67_02985 [Chthonomonadales bacterium]